MKRTRAQRREKSSLFDIDIAGDRNISEYRLIFQCNRKRAIANTKMDHYYPANMLFTLAWSRLLL